MIHSEPGLPPPHPLHHYLLLQVNVKTEDDDAAQTVLKGSVGGARANGGGGMKMKTEAGGMQMRKKGAGRDERKPPHE